MLKSPRLSKSRFMDGLQCHKLLWWKVHEPDAPELTVDAATQLIFDRGHQVGELAQQHVPGGVLIDEPYYEIEQRVASTAKALADGAPVIYEASFQQDGVYVAVDILERKRGGFVLSEVKSTVDVKEQHVADVAVQLHVARRAGVPVKRAEVMHLNRECHHPDLSNLFVRKNVTKAAEAIARTVPKEVKKQLAVLQGPRPDVATGAHCRDPYDCPFLKRCWPPLPEHHVSALYRISAKKVLKLVKAGQEMILDLPDDFEANGAAARQIKSVREGRIVIDEGLRGALSGFELPLAFLDFETISPAVPMWPGCRPYGAVPVQFSCHVQTATGVTHHEWLADGAGDPREVLAQALIAACKGAKTVFAYHDSFEKHCIKGLAATLPRLAEQLMDVHNRIQDPLPIVRDHVYHPAFNGSFSLKIVLPALIPEMGYSDLEVREGGTASAALEGLLLSGEELPAKEKAKLRQNLLRYCERDTLAMVRLYEKLRELAGT